MEPKSFLLGLVVGLVAMYLVARGAMNLAVHKIWAGLCLGTIKVVDDNHHTDGRKKVVRWHPPRRPSDSGEYRDVFELGEGDIPR